MIVIGGVVSTQSAYSAYRFAEQAVSSGHNIRQVFFYRDGVTQANQLATPMTDEFDAVSAWARLAQTHAMELVVCVSAAERRGVLNAEQKEEFGAAAANLHPAFKVEGLGVMHDACLSAQRTVTFK